MFYRQILLPNYLLIEDVINIPHSEKADIMLLAIAGQESNWEHRYQIVGGKRKGPARGFWQFERGGGVAGVMRHSASKNAARRLTEFLEIPWDRTTIWKQLETNDALAVGFARLLLWTDPRSIPTTPKAAWNCYYRNWRPGKPHPHKWGKIWQSSSREVKENV